MKTQTRPKKRRPKNLERLYLAPIRSDGLLVVVEGGRSYTKQEIMLRATAFLNVSDRIECEICGRVYDGTNYFMVEYTGLLDKLRHAYCGDCKPQIKKILDIIYRRI
ncbi:hypothetical protein PyrSV_gp13 [Pyrobaculum spherical virus]|jgi:hypothetical protein|uniref:Uncharacterized protein n=1 Tax=Pyrobaculum spherical virus (isolate United States/Yellowstone) TaxID=654907 RepID=Q6ZYJ0_PSVY|nr:hypothetical protein PyrSV_gp13 [Pyrobaculum spherical virus]CAG25632.1 hypothetical protein [Pyrobaculum spherical virus]